MHAAALCAGVLCLEDAARPLFGAYAGTAGGGVAVPATVRISGHAGRQFCGCGSHDHSAYLAPHPALGSVEYLADFDEVKAKGVGLGMRCSTTVTSATRTADETVMGIYWGYDGARGLGTPPRLYNPCVRTIAEQEKTASAKTRDPDGSVRSHHKRQLTTRTAILENALSRVYLGVHWRFDGLGAPGVGGVAAGTKIAEEVFASYFKAVGPLRVPAAQAKRGKGFAKGRAQTKG